MSCQSRDFDVIVVGAGHAGCEAALAAARMGCRTALLTLDRIKIALMPCNPSIGGPGKGHLVREIDALGGEMARNTDRTSVQIRLLNTGKGPAVRARRAQSDKHAYSQAMRLSVERQENLTLIEASVEDLVLTREARSARVEGIRTADGRVLHASSVVLTTGTFLKGRIIVGDESYPGGRAGEFPADALSQSLAGAGFTLGRLKTGTPPRVHRGSIDWSLTCVQEGSDRPLFLSHDAHRAYELREEFAPSPEGPIASLGSSMFDVQGSTGSMGSAGRQRGSGQGSGVESRKSVVKSQEASGEREKPTADRQRATASNQPAMANGAPFATHTWRHQLNCFLVHTNDQTHEVIRDNLHRAPMYNGEITAAGPRYCPSIEAKIVRFAEKSSHQLFLEPEGWHTDEIYVQGANTSLPVDVQLAMLRTIPALRQAEIIRVGYAIEYDYIPALQVKPSLESKPIEGLFLAGQIIGTTGYEEAAALGIMAGINAGRAGRREEPVVLRRDQGYIGVLVDDLVTKELREPYRMHTSQAEYRLLLREDSAEARLARVGFESGLLTPERLRVLEDRSGLTEAALASLDTLRLTPSAETNQRLESAGATPITTAMTGREILRRADISIDTLASLGCVLELPEDAARELETRVKYEGYIERQSAEVRRLGRMEERGIPEWVDYGTIQGLRSESREKLAQVRPRTIGQASRIGGVPPSDVALILFHLEKQRRMGGAVHT